MQNEFIENLSYVSCTDIKFLNYPKMDSSILLVHIDINHEKINSKRKTYYLIN